MDKQLITIKQRYGIIGFDPALDYAIHIAVQVAPTDLSVLITGESGVGKESFPKIIHDFSANKHGQYIAVNCGAIPEGTIDSELFGHEKGSFTGATEARKGYFEVADGGTIFLDEVADLPLSTQVRLLRVLENGEFIKVGSSKPQKTKVRVVAATNVNIAERIAKGKFREDLFYRLNSVPINIPPLRDRKGDIFLLFTKFATDFAAKYMIPPLHLTDEAKEELARYSWPGNVRQLRNVTEQISLIEKERVITKEMLAGYLTAPTVSSLPVLMSNEKDTPPQFFERELIYKFLTDLTKEVAELKLLVNELKNAKPRLTDSKEVEFTDYQPIDIKDEQEPDMVEEDLQAKSLSLMEVEKEMIQKALETFGTNRQAAAKELGISERTLYRKIKEYGI
jgi:transcriptional regulator with PAS, ATPase and Fis domain